MAALEAGKHVFLEKPMASTVADCDTIIAAAKRSKGILQIGHICRFNPRYRMAKQAIEAGKIGKIVAMSSRRNIPAAWTPEILNKIGPIVGDAIHDTDLMLWFTGDRIVSAYAQTVDVRGLKYPDIGQTMYRFAGGATATLETVWCMPEKTPFDIDERMSIIGDAGIIHIQDTFPNLGIVSSDKLHSPGHDLLAGVRRRARRRAARGIFLFRGLRAEGRNAGDRPAGRRGGGARSDARGRGIGAHRRGRSHRQARTTRRTPMAKRVLVVGLGNMGMSHALAYARIPGFEVVGVCERRIADRKLPPELAKAKKFAKFEEALAELKPDVVSINTLPDTHADFAIKAMEAGAHVFVEKPLADNVANAEKVVETAQRTKRKLVVGYILRQHPSWIKFIEIARQLGTPLVFRMNLNQQSNGATWEWHKRLMDSFPPIVDCGVHYVDVMCQMTKAQALSRSTRSAPD